MVTQKGVVWLRGNLLFKAILIGLLICVSVSVVAGSLVQAEESDAPRAGQPEYGFNESAVYRKFAKDDLVYRTDESVESVQFIVRDSNDQDVEGLEVSGEKNTVGGVTEWRFTHIPETATVIQMQSSPGDEPGEGVISQVTLHDTPTLAVMPFSSPQRGDTLDIFGSISGVMTDDASAVLGIQLLPRGGGEPVANETVESVKDTSGGLAQLQLDEGVRSGNYTVHLTLGSNERTYQTVSSDVTIARDPISVSTLAVNPAVVYTTSTFRVSGQINTSFAVTSATLYYGSQSVGLDVNNDKSFTYQLSPSFLAGNHTFFVVAEDEFGNTNINSPDQQGRITVFIQSPVVNNPPVELLPTLTKESSRRLSTNFSTPIATNRSVSSTPIVRTAARDDDMSAVLGSETKALEGVLDLDSEDDTATLPVEATPGGWMIFGTPWYWWLTGGLAATGAGVYTFRWMVRRT